MGKDSKIYRKLKFEYNQLDPDSRMAIKLDNELEHYEYDIVCNFTQEEGCDMCRYKKECELRDK